MGPRSTGNPPPYSSTLPRPPDPDDLRRRRIQMAREETAAWCREFEKNMASVQSEILIELRQFRLEQTAQLRLPQPPPATADPYPYQQQQQPPPPPPKPPVPQQQQHQSAWYSNQYQYHSLQSPSPPQLWGPPPHSYHLPTPPGQYAPPPLLVPTGHFPPPPFPIPNPQNTPHYPQYFASHPQQPLYQHQPPIYNVVQKLTISPAHTDQLVTPPPLAQFTASPLPLLGAAPSPIHPPKIHSSGLQIFSPLTAQPTIKPPPLLDGAISSQPNSSPASFCSVSSTNTSVSNQFNCGGMGFVFGAKLNGIDEKLENGESVEKRAEVNGGDGREFSELVSVSAKQNDSGLSLCGERRECNADESGKGILENEIEYDQNPSTPNLNIGFSNTNTFNQPQSGNTSGLGGLAGISGQSNFGQSYVAQGYAAVQQPIPAIISIGTLTVMPQMSIARVETAPSIQYGFSSMPIMTATGLNSCKSQLSTMEMTTCIVKKNESFGSKIGGKGALCIRLKHYIEGLKKISHNVLQLCLSGFDKKVRDKGSGHTLSTDEFFTQNKKFAGNMRLLWVNISNLISSIGNLETVASGNGLKYTFSLIITLIESLSCGYVEKNMRWFTKISVTSISSGCVSLHHDQGLVSSGIEFNSFLVNRNDERIVVFFPNLLQRMNNLQLYVDVVHKGINHVIHTFLSFKAVVDLSICANIEFGIVTTLNAWLNGNLLCLLLENKLEKMSLFFADKFEKMEGNARMMFDDIWGRWKSIVMAANEYCTEELHVIFPENHMKRDEKCLRYILSTLDVFLLRAQVDDSMFNGDQGTPELPLGLIYFRMNLVELLVDICQLLRSVIVVQKLFFGVWASATAAIAWKDVEIKLFALNVVTEVILQKSQILDFSVIMQLMVWSIRPLDELKGSMCTLHRSLADVVDSYSMWISIFQTISRPLLLFLTAGISETLSSSSCASALCKFFEDASVVMYEPSNLEILMWIGEGLENIHLPLEDEEEVVSAVSLICGSIYNKELMRNLLARLLSSSFEAIGKFVDNSHCPRQKPATYTQILNSGAGELYRMGTVYNHLVTSGQSAYSGDSCMLVLLQVFWPMLDKLFRSKHMENDGKKKRFVQEIYGKCAALAIIPIDSEEDEQPLFLNFVLQVLDFSPYLDDNLDTLAHDLGDNSLAALRCIDTTVVAMLNTSVVGWLHLILCLLTHGLNDWKRSRGYHVVLSLAVLKIHLFVLTAWPRAIIVAVLTMSLMSELRTSFSMLEVYSKSET